MSGRRPTRDYADEQQAILKRVGLTEDVCAANENAPTRGDLYAQFDKRVPSTDRMRSPGPLSKEQIVEAARVDGYVDALLGMPMHIAHRFCEANLYLENMGKFPDYSEAYQDAYRKAGAK
jgi:hypothetical protein